MNAADAYEEHTDLIRALARKDSPERKWFDDYHETVGMNPMTGAKQPVIALGDPAYRLARAREGQWAADAHVIVSHIPTAPVDDTGEVGVIDPERLRIEFAGQAEPDDSVPEMVAVPRPILTDIAVDSMSKAPTVYVTADMVTVLEHAAAALDETDMMPFHPAYPNGFAVLARPLRLPYGDGTEQLVHAFGWTTLIEVRTAFGGTGRVGCVWQFVDRRHADGDRAVGFAQQRQPSRRSWEDSPALVFNVMDQFVTGTPVGEPVETEGASVGERFKRALLEALDSQEGAAGAAPATEPDTGEVRVVGRFQPYLAAFLLLLGQEITATRREPVHDYARKRARRTGRTSESVTVIDLAPRRHGGFGDEASESGRHYTVRHLVDGHWRWQPYGPERRLRRRIYVAGYVRGPEDAPLVIKPRVRRL